MGWLPTAEAVCDYERAFTLAFQDVLAQIPASVMSPAATDVVSFFVGLGWVREHIHTLPVPDAVEHLIPRTLVRVSVMEDVLTKSFSRSRFTESDLHRTLSQYAWEGFAHYHAMPSDCSLTV